MNAMMKITAAHSMPSRQVTMSSLELVEFINAQRGPATVQLRHDHFMAKVPKVLSFHAPKFLGTHKYGNGNSRESCVFRKREACLMAMCWRRPNIDPPRRSKIDPGRNAALKSGVCG
jgi:hypothetical protein